MLLLVQRGHYAKGAAHSGEKVADGDADTGWLVRLWAGQAHQTGLALSDLVVAGTTALRSVVAEAGDRQDHQLRLQFVQPRRREAEPVQDARPRVLDQDIGCQHQSGECLPPIIALQVESGRLLIPVARQEVCRFRALLGPDEALSSSHASPRGLTASLAVETAVHSRTAARAFPRSTELRAGCGRMLLTLNEQRVLFETVLFEVVMQDENDRHGGEPDRVAARQSEIVLRFLAAPMDITYGGGVDGGRLLEWIDKAGYACAAGWSGRYCVTAYVGDVRFSRPVATGEMVEVRASSPDSPSLC